MTFSTWRSLIGRVNATPPKRLPLLVHGRAIGYQRIESKAWGRGKLYLGMGKTRQVVKRVATSHTSVGNNEAEP
jgi:hypothetical protein